MPEHDSSNPPHRDANRRKQDAPAADVSTSGDSHKPAKGDGHRLGSDSPDYSTRGSNATRNNGDGSDSHKPAKGEGNDAAPAKAVSVRVEDLKKSYGKQVVLDGVSFEIAPEEIFVLMGPSGAGKSVLLRHVIGLEAPDAGRVLIDGQDANLLETHEQVKSAMVFQAGALFNSMSVYDNLAFYPREHRLYSRRGLDDKVRHTLKILNLEQAAEKMPSQLSGGMKKRVAIARALVMEPRLLLYDEPTSELDPVTSANIAEIIATLKGESTVTSIVVSHDRDLALNIADRIGLLYKGKLVTIDTPEGLKKSDNPIVQEFLHPKIDPEHPRFREQG